MIALNTVLGSIGVAESATADPYILGAAEMFTLLFIVLGPLKLLGGYAQETRSMSASDMRALAIRANLIAGISIIGGGLIGSALLSNWDIDPKILELTLGLVFFVVAFRLVMQQYEHPRAEPPANPDAPPPRALKIVFPLIAPPYGMAAVICLLALSKSGERTLLVCGLIVANVLLNLIAMLYVRSIMKGVGLALMQVLGAVLGVLQVALAVRVILASVSGLGVFSGPIAGH